MPAAAAVLTRQVSHGRTGATVGLAGAAPFPARGPPNRPHRTPAATAVSFLRGRVGSDLLCSKGGSAYPVPEPARRSDWALSVSLQLDIGRARSWLDRQRGHSMIAEILRWRVG